MMMLNSTGPSADLWSAPLVTGLNFAPMMGMSFLASGSEQQGGGIKKSLDWSCWELKEASVSKMQRHRKMWQYLHEILPDRWRRELLKGDVSCRLMPICTILSLVLKIVYHQLKSPASRVE